ncbi:MAG: hypothetical protein U1F98_17405 [Verrucomicrobiota bacterium]
MKFQVAMVCAGMLLPLAGAAQETNQVEQLRQELRQIQEQSERKQQEQQRQIEQLNRKLDELQRQGAAAASPTSAPAGPPGSDDLGSLSRKVDQVVEAQKKTLLSEFNPSIGFVSETLFFYQSQASDATGAQQPAGFNVYQRSMELNLAASVDPFAKGYAVINATADAATGEATLGFEEAAIQTTSLPWNLELTGGMFFGEFGRLAYVHDHELPFVNRPLVLEQYIGGESKTVGAQMNWLVPVEHYISATFGIGTQFGEPPNNPGGNRTFNELNFWGRIGTYYDLTPNWQLEMGVSGMMNPATEDRGGATLEPNGISTATEKERRLVGGDLKLTWTPLQNNQFQSFVLGSELLYSDNYYLFNPDGVSNTGDEYYGNEGALGLYTYATYRWTRSWSGGFLFDWVQNDTSRQNATFAYSPYVTWAISHWNQIRLQYTHTEYQQTPSAPANNAVYLQWVWIIGSHSHGWAAR